MKLKIAFFIIVAGVSNVLANPGYSQVAKVSLDMENKSLEQVMDEIELQSEFYFIFNQKQIDVSRIVNIQEDNKLITDILPELFKGTNVNYAVLDRKILLTTDSLDNTIKVLALETELQQTIISGTVTDASTSEAMAGVNIQIKGTTVGAISNSNGEYSIPYVGEPKGTLIFSFIGYVSLEVLLDGRTVINVALAPEITGLDEVVVIGYGTTKKSDLTGSVSNISGDRLKNVPVRSIADAMQGKLAGVLVTSTSGSPGAPPAVRIRGVGTVNDNAPLYVVDGLPQSDIGWLNTNNIASIDILKDASASAIYGSRAANGVIIISTVRGNPNLSKTEISFGAYSGVANPIKKYDMMNASEFIDYKNIATVNGGGSPIWTSDQKNQILQFLKENTGSEEGTNWWNETSHKNAPVQNYNLSISGGAGDLRYHTNLEYMDQKGIIKYSDYNRISWLTNFDHKLSSWLKMSGNFGLVEQKRRISNENTVWGTVFCAVVADPISPVWRKGLKNIPSFLEDAFFMDQVDPTDRYSWYSPVITTNKQNPVAEMDILKDSFAKTTSLKGGLSLEAEITKWLRFKTNFGIDLARDGSDSFTPKYYLDGDQFSNNAIVNKSYGHGDYWVWDNTLTFQREFNDHNILAMVGVSTEETKSEFTSASKQGLVNNDPYQRVLDAASISPNASGGISESSLYSYFGRVFYSYRGKYLFTGNIRRDGSSRFGSDNRWGTFPSVSVAWNLAKEPFMENLNWLSQSKLRLSWGQIGNQAISRGAYLSTYSGSWGYYLFGTNLNPVVLGGSNSIGNPGVKWETTEQVDLGLDLGFFKGKLIMTIDYFSKTTKDMLLQVPLESYLGYPNTPWINAGSILNKGMEFEVRLSNTYHDFDYSIGANLFTFKNKVVKLGSGEPIYSTIWGNALTATKTEIGKPIGYFYGLKTDGIFQNENEINSYKNDKGELIQPKARPGDLKFMDVNGDGSITSGDRTYLGSSFPKISYGFNFSGAYKGFDLQCDFMGVYGNKIMNAFKSRLYAGDGWFNSPRDFLEKAWSPENPTNEYFGFNTDNTNNLQISDWLVEDGSYLRLKKIELGYSLPSEITSKLNISRARVWLGAFNILTITKYSGIEPEIGKASPLLNGVDDVYYPQPKSTMIGINVTF